MEQTARIEGLLVLDVMMVFTTEESVCVCEREREGWMKH